MTTVSINIDERIAERARDRAAKQGTSLDSVLQEYLRRYADGEEAESAVKEFLELAKQSASSSGSPGRTWTRESLYDR